MYKFVTEKDIEYGSFLDTLQKLEKLHPVELRWSKRNRKEFLDTDEGKAIWLFVDGELVGEILWADEVYDHSGKIPVTKTAYIYSTTTVKAYQNKGYSKLLKFVLYTHLRNLGYDEVRGHAKEGKSWDNTYKLGAKLIKKIENYWDTNETYYYYKHKLNNAKVKKTTSKFHRRTLQG